MLAIHSAHGFRNGPMSKINGMRPRIDAFNETLWHGQPDPPTGGIVTSGGRWRGFSCGN